MDPAQPHAVLRAAAFAFLAVETDGGERSVGWKRLQSGLVVDGTAVTLIRQKGIWRPAGAILPISINDALAERYDEFRLATWVALAAAAV